MPEQIQPEQSRLFGGEPESPAPFDAAQTAEHIAAHARPFTPKDRTSDAAQDQGHGPYEKPVEATPQGAKQALKDAQARVAARKAQEESARMQEIIDAGTKISQGLINPRPYEKD